MGGHAVAGKRFVKRDFANLALNNVRRKPIVKSRVSLVEQIPLAKRNGSGIPGGNTAAGQLIYVVDDNQMVGELVETILQTRDYQTKGFENPRVALAAFLDEPVKPPILITDFVMDELNGMELIQKCIEAVPNLRTILYSGNVGQECMRGYPVAPDHFLAKPFSPSRLLELVDELSEGL